jgi:site-specific DNA-methyltransferase (adenine-specific)
VSVARPRPVPVVLHGDCLHVLRTMPDADVEAVVTDPPWNWGKDYGGHDDAMPPDRYALWLGRRLAECARVSRGPVVFMPGARNLHLVPIVLGHAALRCAGLLWWGRAEDAGASREPVLWAVRRAGAAAPPATGWLGVHRAFRPVDGGHPCPKPVDLMRRLVTVATPCGGTVLDPFTGSGTTLLAAAALGRQAIGIELNHRYCSAAARAVGARAAGAAS